MSMIEFNPKQHWTVHYHRMTFRTRECLEFLDITEQLAGFVCAARLSEGILTVQSLHTTAAIVINENEPLLLEDMRRMLERVAPRDLEYQHNDFRIRTVNMTDHEDRNGHSHCKALFLPTSQTIHIVDGKLNLGTWQRIFLLELDCSRKRNVSLLVMGN